MRFHLALPELNGFGVMTFTPLFTRLAQLVMCFGLPWRTTKETIELVTNPFVGVAFHLDETMPALTSFCISGASEKLTTSAGNPATTAVACEPEAPNDEEKVTPCPAGVALKSLMSTV